MAKLSPVSVKKGGAVRTTGPSASSRRAAPRAVKKPAAVKTPKADAITVPKGGSADVREIDNGKVVRVTDENYNTVQEVFVPEGQDVNIR